MAERSDRVSPHEADKHLLRILGSIKPSKENNACSRVLNALFDQWKEDSRTTMLQIPLAAKAKLPVDEITQNSSTAVRQAIGKLRNELIPRFYRQNPHEALELEIPENPRGVGYNLDIRRRPTASDAGDQEIVPIVLEHRHNSGRFRKVICEANNILFVTVGSQHTLDIIFPWFENQIVRASHFRVLVWRPESAEIARAFTDHTGESASRFVEKQMRAWQSWKRMELDHPFIEVYGYTSVPTLQGLCGDDSVQIEILPFHPAVPHDHQENRVGISITDHRPALWLDATEHSRSFELFQNAFENLWIAAMGATREDDVHPRWRERREILLLERRLKPST